MQLNNRRIFLLSFIVLIISNYILPPIYLFNKEISIWIILWQIITNYALLINFYLKFRLNSKTSSLIVILSNLILLECCITYLIAKDDAQYIFLTGLFLYNLLTSVFKLSREIIDK